VTFDYGNNLRGRRPWKRGWPTPSPSPASSPNTSAPLFCVGKGAVPLGGRCRATLTTSARPTGPPWKSSPATNPWARWLRLAGERVRFQGLPARICWLGYGERAKLGLRFNAMVRKGELRGPIVIGRDHLDAGSVASPNRETEAMRDGSDAIADWPILNALVNTACGAGWVSVPSRRRAWASALACTRAW